jgi:tetratricopeptide (TPR) repeat protein
MSKQNKPHPQQKKELPSEKGLLANAWLWPLLLVIITWALYHASLNNELTTWDDKNYINENTFIRSTKSDSLKMLFTPGVETGGYIMGNYHPLTIVSYAMEYGKHGLDPRPYHVTNLVFHVLNTLLVYLFILLLSRGKRVAAFLTALLFSLHPMHVESVAWVAERKDVMFTFFFLAALCVYVKYIRLQKGWLPWLLLAVALFVLSLLSKAMAVTLPVVMLLVDYYEGRKLDARLIIEKIPFFILAVIFGLIAVKAQASAGAIGSFETYTFSERIILSCYGLCLYLYKAILPIKLTCFYSYPGKVNDHLPAFVYLFPLIIAALLFLAWWSRRFGRTVLFGAAFFLVTIALVLQILPVGGAIIAERYTYIPYIGLFFMFSMWITALLEKHISAKPAVLGVCAVLAIAFFIAAKQRTKVWKDSVTLWSDAISKDKKAPVPFNGRGDAYNMQKKYDLAIADFQQALSLQEKYHEAHYNLGLAYYYKGLHQEAIKEYTRAIQIKPDLAVAYFNRSGTYYTLQQFQPALDDALKAKQYGYNVDPRYIEALQQGVNSR